MLPYRPPVYRLVPKGRKDCGNHEWGQWDSDSEVCYYCVAERPYDPDHDLRFYDPKAFRAR